VLGVMLWWSLVVVVVRDLTLPEVISSYRKDRRLEAMKHHATTAAHERSVRGSTREVMFREGGCSGDDHAIARSTFADDSTRHAHGYGIRRS